MLCIIFKKEKQLLEVGTLKHLNEYILERNCFHMIFQGKDLPMVASMKNVSQRSLKKIVCCASYSRKKNSYLNHISELILERDFLHVIFLGIDFSTVAEFKT